MPNRKIGDVFARWKKTHRAYTDDAIAALVGCDRSTITYLRLGRVAPQPRTLDALLRRVPGFRDAYRVVTGTKGGVK